MVTYSYSVEYRFLRVISHQCLTCPIKFSAPTFYQRSANLWTIKDDLSSETTCLNEHGRILDDLESVLLSSLKSDQKLQCGTTLIEWYCVLLVCVSVGLQCTLKSGILLPKKLTFFFAYR